MGHNLSLIFGVIMLGLLGIAFLAIVFSAVGAIVT